MKKILIVTNEYIPETENGITGGRGYRLFYFKKELENNNFEVNTVYFNVHSDLDNICILQEPVQLEKFIKKNNYDIIFFSPWKLLFYLQYRTNALVCSDLTGTILLENMFSEEKNNHRLLLEKLVALNKSDMFIIPNNKQKYYFYSFMKLAGIENLNNRIIDFSVSVSPNYNSANKQYDIINLINAGVFWSWQKNKTYFDKVVKFIENNKNFKLNIIGGKYYKNLDFKYSDTFNYFESVKQKKINNINFIDYSSIQKFTKVLSDNNIGIEIYDKNIERELIVSTRSISYLSVGLPIIISDFMVLAEDIKKYDAGWLINNPDDLFEVLNEIQNNKKVVKQKSENALKLFNDKFNIENNIKNFINKIDNYVKPINKKNYSFIEFIDNLNKTNYNLTETINYFKYKVNEKDEVIKQLNTRISGLSFENNELKNQNYDLNFFKQDYLRIINKPIIKFMIKLKKIINIILNK